MTAFDYTRPRATAARLLERFGQTGVIRRLTQGAGEPHNPGPAVPADHPCTFVVDIYKTFERDGTLIKAGDKKVLVKAEGLAIAPTTSDKIIIAGEVHTIVSVEPLSPAGTVVMYTVQARR